MEDEQPESQEQAEIKEDGPPRGIASSITTLSLQLEGFQVDQKYSSKIPKSNSSTVNQLLKRYSTDLIYRTLFDTFQLMHIANKAGKNEVVEDKLLDPITNHLQYVLFRDIEKSLRRSVSFPDEYERNIGNTQVERLTTSLADAIRHAQTTYMFRFILLNCIQIDNSIKQYIRRLVPNHKFYILINLLKLYFVDIDADEVKTASRVSEETKFNVITNCIWNFGTDYEMSYGIFYVDEHTPINSITNEKISPELLQRIV